MKSVIILACVAAVSVIADIIIGCVHDGWTARIMRKYNARWNAKEHRRGIIMKFHLAVMVVMVLLGVAAYRFKELGWIRYVGIGLSVLYFAFGLFALIYLYARLDGSLSKSNYFRNSFPKYTFTTVVGNRYLLVCVTSLAMALIWIFLF